MSTVTAFATTAYSLRRNDNIILNFNTSLNPPVCAISPYKKNNNNDSTTTTTTMTVDDNTTNTTPTTTPTTTTTTMDIDYDTDAEQSDEDEEEENDDSEYQEGTKIINQLCERYGISLSDEMYAYTLYKRHGMDRVLRYIKSKKVSLYCR